MNMDSLISLPLFRMTRIEHVVVALLHCDLGPVAMTADGWLSGVCVWGGREQGAEDGSMEFSLFLG